MVVDWHWWVIDGGVSDAAVGMDPGVFGSGG